MKRLVIIGGGITGLSAAWYARELPVTTEIVLLEGKRRLGGQIRTVEREGFRLEEGSDSFYDPEGQVLDLCRGLGIAGGLSAHTTGSRSLLVRRESSFYPIPARIFDALSPIYIRELAASTLLSASAKRRLNMEAQIPPLDGNTDESIAQFFARRLGPEVERSIIEPLIQALYAASPNRLSTAAIFPQLRELEHRYGSLSRGIARSSLPTDGGTRLTLSGGMTEIIDALQRHLGRVRIVTGHRAVGIRREDGAYAISLDGRHDLRADAIICATPAYETAALVERVDAPAAALLRAVPYGSTDVVHLGYRRHELGDGREVESYVAPAGESSEAAACTWRPCIWDNRAPRDHVLLRFSTVTRSDASASRSDGELLSMTTNEVSRALASDATPCLQNVARWERARPLYNVGHVELIARLEERLLHIPGLFAAGNFLRGAGIANCVASAARAVRLAAPVIGRRGDRRMVF